MTWICESHSWWVHIAKIWLCPFQCVCSPGSSLAGVSLQIYAYPRVTLMITSIISIITAVLIPAHKPNAAPKLDTKSILEIFAWSERYIASNTEMNISKLKKFFFMSWWYVDESAVLYLQKKYPDEYQPLWPTWFNWLKHGKVITYISYRV